MLNRGKQEIPLQGGFSDHEEAYNLAMNIISAAKSAWAVYLSVYVCVCIYMWLLMCVLMNTYYNISRKISVSSSFICLCMPLYIYVIFDVCVCVSVNTIFVRREIHPCVHAYIHTRRHTYMHTSFVHNYIYIYIYIYIFCECNYYHNVMCMHRGHTFIHYAGTRNTRGACRQLRTSFCVWNCFLIMCMHMHIYI